MKRFAITTLLVAAATLTLPDLVAAQDADAGQAYYTEEQAEAGQRMFAISCGGCHGTDMVDVFAGYATAESYYLFISGSMPADNPGSLAPQQYADIMAYLMREVGFPSGDEKLTADRAILAEIVPADAPGKEE